MTVRKRVGRPKKSVEGQKEAIQETFSNEVVKEVGKDGKVLDKALKEIRAMFEGKTPNQLSLYEKIFCITHEIGVIQKDINIEQGKNSYRAVSERAIVERVKELELKYGVLSYVSKIERVDSEVKTVIGKEGGSFDVYIDNVNLTLLVKNIHRIDEELSLLCPSKGIDIGDKGLGMAITYGRKYLLMMLYKIVTGEDIDSKASEKIIDLSAREKCESVRVKLNEDKKTAANIMQVFGASSVDELSEADMLKIYEQFKIKKML